MAREYPGKQVHVIRTVAERKPHSASRPPDLGGTRQKDWAGIEVFRFDAAEKIEHWDVLQVVPTEARNAESEEFDARSLLNLALNTPHS